MATKTKDRHDDVKFLEQSDAWPFWPVCPVKKRVDNNLPICGLVFAGTTQVVMLNLFQGWDKEAYDQADKHQYETLDELVADGWVVD